MCKRCAFLSHFLPNGCPFLSLARVWGAFVDERLRFWYPRSVRMCPPLGLARNVSESVRFRTKINTILADDHLGIFPEPKQPASQPANQPASRPASMCSPVGWAGNVSESVRFRIKINTTLAEDHFGISPVPNQAATLRKRLSA